MKLDSILKSTILVLSLFVFIGCQTEENSSANAQSTTTSVERIWLNELSASVSTITNKSSITQPSNDPNELLEMAENEKNKYYNLVTEICSTENNIDCTVKFPPQAKSLERIQEKTTDGRYDKILDYSRATIITSCANTGATLNIAIKTFGSENIVRIKNRLANPTPGGYRDIMINYIDPQTLMVSELLIIEPLMFEIKNGEGHTLYEKARSITDAAEAQSRALTYEEAKLVNEYNTQAQELYNNAYQNSCIASLTSQ